MNLEGAGTNNTCGTIPKEGKQYKDIKKTVKRYIRLLSKKFQRIMKI